METNENQIVTSIAANAQIEVPFDICYFGLAAQAEAETAPYAKKKLSDIIGPAVKAIEGYRARGGIDPKTSRTSAQINRKERKRSSGFLATWQASFSLTNLELANDLFNELIETGVDVWPPRFAVQNIDAAQSEALKVAVARAKARFAEECAMIGTHAAFYKIGSWQAQRYDNARGRSVGTAAFAMAAATNGGGGGDDLEVLSGGTQVNVAVTLNYVPISAEERARLRLTDFDDANT